MQIFYSFLIHIKASQVNVTKAYENGCTSSFQFYFQHWVQMHEILVQQCTKIIMMSVIIF